MSERAANSPPPDSAAPSPSSTAASAAALPSDVPARRPRESQLARLRNRDHTRGSLLKSLFILALPMLASSALLLAYQLADLAFLARLGEGPMAAVIISAKMDSTELLAGK